jgi:hypothetical protein
MTTPIVPDFIAELFKNEIQKIQENVVKQICDVYGLDQEEVMESIGLQEVKFEHSRLRISKKHETEYGSKKHTEKCTARIFAASQVQLYQCKRSRLGGCNFCKTHLEMIKRGGLKWGTINDPVPQEVQVTQSKKLY